MKRVRAIITKDSLKIVSFVVISSLDSIFTFEFAIGKEFDNIDAMNDYILLVLKNNHFYVKQIERAFNCVLHDVLYQDISELGKFTRHYTIH